MSKPATRPGTARGLWLFALVASVGACNQIFGIQSGVTEASGAQGGASSASTSASASSASSTTSSTSSTSASSGASSTSSSGSASSSSGAILAGCALLLHMDEPSWTGSGAVVKDASGLGNHGTPMGNAKTIAAGKFGRAGSFDGASSVTVPDAPSLHPTTALTYAAWIYPTGLTDGTPSPGILSKRLGYADQVAFTLFLWTNNQVWGDVESSRFSSSAVVANGSWYHLAIVYDGGSQSAKLYVNGALDGTHAAASSLAVNTVDLQIANLPGGGDYFIGAIDEVAVWTRALSGAEIAGLAAATTPL